MEISTNTRNLVALEAPGLAETAGLALALGAAQAGQAQARAAVKVEQLLAAQATTRAPIPRLVRGTGGDADADCPSRNSALLHRRERHRSRTSQAIGIRTEEVKSAAAISPAGVARAVPFKSNVSPSRTATVNLISSGCGAAV